MAEKSTSCTQCGQPVPTDAPKGICPKCLIGLAIRPADQDSNTTPYGGARGPALNADQLVGKFPNLEILHFVGHGGMGAVYLARQTNLDRTVALKILSPHLSNDPSFTERFTREAKTLAKLQHANIVTVFDFGESEGMHYLVMEFVDGVNLRDAISAKQLNQEVALRIVPQVCDALQYAHTNGVIHRDIKPENILIDKSGHVKIADFGLAKLLEPSEQDFTLTGTRQVLGTMNYMAPEQIEHPETVDHRADLYSLGVVFYELLTGELPIGRFALPSEKAPISNGLDNVVLKTLEKEPERRYQQASQIKSAVESVDDVEGKRLYAEAANRMQTQVDKPKRTGDRTLIAKVLPFSTYVKKQGGWMVCLGIARLDQHCIEFEYDDHDRFWHSKLKLDDAIVKLSDISSVKLSTGLIQEDKITIQANSKEAIASIPYSTHGAVTIYTKKSDKDVAQEFVDALKSQLAPSKPDGLGVARRPAPPRKTVEKEGVRINASEYELFTTRERLKVPRIGLLLGGCVYLLIGFVMLIWNLKFLTIDLQSIGLSEMFNWDRDMPERATWMIGSVTDSYGYFWTATSITTLMSLAIGFLSVMCSIMIKQLRNFHFCVLTLLIILVGMCFGGMNILVAPFALWGIIVMCFAMTRQVFRSQTYQHALKEPQARSLNFGLTLLSIVMVLAAVGMVTFISVQKIREHRTRTKAVEGLQRMFLNEVETSTEQPKVGQSEETD